MSAENFADALIVAASAAARWPKWCMGINPVPGCVEPLEAASRWMGVKRNTRQRRGDPIGARIVCGYRQRFGSYYNDLYRRPWQLSANLFTWAMEEAEPMRSAYRLEAVEKLDQGVAVLLMSSLSDDEAIACARQLVVDALGRRGE